MDTDADAAAIKKAYRKLVLSCHPDKVTDESLKAQKQEEFHQIQQAYETIGDPDNRTKYDLELKAKKLREERDRMNPKGSPSQSRNFNINIYTAQHPSEHRSSSSKHSPAKPTSYKPYSAEFSKSCEHSFPNRSRTYEDERRTRRTYSDERLNDESRDRRRREDERERRRRQEEEDERRRKQARRERETLERERELKERARAKEVAKRREQQERQERDERIRAEQKAEKKAKERAAETKRRLQQEAADDKLRAKMRSQEHTSEEDDDNRSRRVKKSSKKDSSSPRDKTPSKYRERERSSPRDEPIPEMPGSTEAYESKMAYAALYINNQAAKKNAKAAASSSPKHTADAASFSAAYPNPDHWVPKRRVSGEKPPRTATAATAAAAAEEPFILDGASSPISPSSQQHQAPPPPPPPRLQKSSTMGHVPTFDPRPALSRAQTFDPEAFTRSGTGMGMGASSSSAERPRLSRQRTTIDDVDDYYGNAAPRVQKYSIRADKGGMPRTVDTSSSHYHSRDPYAAGGPTSSWPKFKTAQSYGPEHLSHSKRYDHADILFADYASPQSQAYVATHS